MAAFEHHDHVSEISIYCPMSSEWKKFAMAMLGPFLALTSLVLVACGAVVLVLPETFLGGSAPSLRTLILDRIPFPALPKLLSSATRLVSFRLWNVPGTGYISPKAMAACLAALPCLEEFRIETQTGPLADEQSPPPPTPAVLPSLTLFHFKGIIGYLEHLIARTNSPRLTTLSITSYGLILHIPQLHRFIGCASNIKTPNRVVVEFYFSMVNLKFMPSDSFTLSMMHRDAAVWFRTLVRTRTFLNRTKVRSGVRGWGRTGPTVPSGVRGGAEPGGTVQNRVRTLNRKVSMWSGARAPHVELYFCPQSCCLCGRALAHPLVNCWYVLFFCLSC